MLRLDQSRLLAQPCRRVPAFRGQASAPSRRPKGYHLGRRKSSYPEQDREQSRRSRQLRCPRIRSPDVEPERRFDACSHSAGDAGLGRGRRRLRRAGSALGWLVLLGVAAGRHRGRRGLAGREAPEPPRVRGRARQDEPERARGRGAASWSSASSPSWAIAGPAAAPASPRPPSPPRPSGSTSTSPTAPAAGLDVATGVFRAMMKVELVNDGPVTLLLDSRKQF